MFYKTGPATFVFDQVKWSWRKGMVKRNENIAKLPGGYLFPEINRRKQEFLKKNPTAKVISLGIGNTTEPVTPLYHRGTGGGGERSRHTFRLLGLRR